MRVVFEVAATDQACAVAAFIERRAPNRCGVKLLMLMLGIIAKWCSITLEPLISELVADAALNRPANVANQCCLLTYFVNVMPLYSLGCE